MGNADTDGEHDDLIRKAVEKLEAVLSGSAHDMTGTANSG